MSNNMYLARSIAVVFAMCLMTVSSFASSVLADEDFTDRTWFKATFTPGAKSFSVAAFTSAIQNSFSGFDSCQLTTIHDVPQFRDGYLTVVFYFSDDSYLFETQRFRNYLNQNNIAAPALQAMLASDAFGLNMLNITITSPITQVVQPDASARIKFVAVFQSVEYAQGDFVAAIHETLPAVNFPKIGTVPAYPRWNSTTETRSFVFFFMGEPSVWKANQKNLADYIASDPTVAKLAERCNTVQRRMELRSLQIYSDPNGARSSNVGGIFPGVADGISIAIIVLLAIGVIGVLAVLFLNYVKVQNADGTSATDGSMVAPANTVRLHQGGKRGGAAGAGAKRKVLGYQAPNVAADIDEQAPEEQAMVNSLATSGDHASSSTSLPVVSHYLRVDGDAAQPVGPIQQEQTVNKVVAAET